MLGVVATVVGILGGIVGTLITLRSFIDQERKEVQANLEAERSKHAEARLKEYAAQRDFQHIQRNQDQMKEAIKLLQEETEEQGKVLIELKTLHQALYHRLESIAARVDGSTGGWGKRD